ncbi:MAG: 2-hydroxyacid dehydrogenase [Clostridia bacterium]|nr:2-hydroxyacid dehydrogenase [Clostridia bacterium]MBR3819526.1 2-hydroxyacid dehydrogenase [Clostridia bacterium]
MLRIAFFDTKPYDKIYFDTLKEEYGIEIEYFESKLSPRTAVMAKNVRAVCAFVNDDICKETIDVLKENGVELIAMRCAGYNNVDLHAAKDVMTVVRVPEYSPHAVAEHTLALLLTLVRKTHKAYIRTRDFNFSLNGFVGFDLHGKTLGAIGTGKIGMAFIDICRGIGMNVIAYDPFPSQGYLEYVPLEELFQRADVISLHCPLTSDTYHMINDYSIKMMKEKVFILNTSRGALIDTESLINGIKSGKIGGAGLDVYEEESEFFYEDLSESILKDDVLSRLIMMPNVLVTSHQAFLTHEALKRIAEITLGNIKSFFDGNEPENEIVAKKKIVI